ncbi:hypothetical protein BD413DRAFT_608159 [Trametes elegans]|nr:hypothetical protein BD413DRAFT_608159 [Trametes elegans]
MSGGEAEYEVESILRAKVASKKGRKAWTYWVKWKNYGIEDNTWEPVESFSDGSEHFVEHFWDRVNTNGRDPNNLRDFRVGEEFFPSGPPRRKKAKKSEKEVNIPSPSPAAGAGDSENEVRSSIIADDDEEPVPPAKDKRRRSSSGAEVQPTSPKRKRGRPPGIRASDVGESEVPKALPRKRSVPELPRTNRARAPVAGSSTSTSRPVPPLPRRRGRPSQGAPNLSSSSPDELLLRPTTNGKARFASSTPSASAAGEVPEDVIMVDDSDSEAVAFGVPTLLGDEQALQHPQNTASVSIPAHRTRAANPRVKPLDDPNLTEASGAISVKARFMRRNATAKGGTDGGGSPSGPARVSRSRAGPGRSSSGLVVGGSRLVAQKGKLTTVKGTTGTVISRASQEASSTEQSGDGSLSDRAGMLFNSAELDEVPGLGQIESEPVPKSPPTGESLLKEAGMDITAATDLPDFEEDAEGEDDIEYIANATQNEGYVPRLCAFNDIDTFIVIWSSSIQQQSSSGIGQVAAVDDDTSVAAVQQVEEAVPENSPVALEARPVTFASRVTSAWSQSTIFGPLALGLSPTWSQHQLRDQPAASSSANKRYTFNLNLDPAVSLPVVLKDTHASHEFLEKLDSAARNPTGKFYEDQFSLALVETLRPHKSYARVAVGDDSPEDHKQHFKRFLSRLQAGDLFIQMNRFEPLVMFAGENIALGQKLDVPAPLLGLAGTAVVAHVSIEDHSAYAEAAEHADSSRWV